MIWLLLLAAVVLAVAAELALALVVFPRRYGATYYQLRSKYRIYRSDGAVGYRHAPNLRYQKVQQHYPHAPRKREYVDVATDKHGFFFEDDIDRLRSDGWKIIFCVGGSTTAGLESRRDKSYPAQLDALLRPHGYRVVNAGLGGGRSIHERLLIERVLLAFDPVAIVIFSGYNDYEAYAYGAYAPGNPHVHYLSSSLPRNAVERALDYSCVYHLVRGRLSRRSTVAAGDAQAFQDALDAPAWLDEWTENTRRAADLCRDRGVKCFLLETMNPVYEGAPEEAKAFADCDLGMNGRFDQWLGFLRVIDTATAELCRGGQPSFIRVRPAFDRYLAGSSAPDYFKRRFTLFLDRAHFSEEANGILASSVFDHLIRELS